MKRKSVVWSSARPKVKVMQRVKINRNLKRSTHFLRLKFRGIWQEKWEDLITFRKGMK
jgi:hypothetical protein